MKEISNINDKNLINGCANITGGGLEDNIKRVIPKNLCAEINLENIKILKIFKWLHKIGISEKEMLKTFNCGVGFCLITKKENIRKIKKVFSKKYQPYEIGFISKKKPRINILGKLRW